MAKLVLDTECYRDYWLIAFRNIANGKVRSFEMYPGKELDGRRVGHIMRNNELISFNGIRYDLPMITLALGGADNLELKQASDYLILDENATPWEFQTKYNVTIQKYNHIDLIEVAPGVMVSLKLYGGRMHSHTLQDLPYDPSASISEADRVTLRDYCANDLVTTQDLYSRLINQIKLREEMGEQYTMDLRSKSDAQIAEAVIKSEVEGIQGIKLSRPTNAQEPFNYIAPDWVSFKTEQLQGILEALKVMAFTVHPETGAVQLPESIANLKIHIGSSVYKMGIGGLHSTEAKVNYVAGEDFTLIDRDVTAYYPSIILNQGLYPKNIGHDFLAVYRNIVDRRIAAKRNNDKVLDATLKIVINGSFGKFGSKWSVLYSPSLLIQTTITGQLALLMLIEMLEEVDIPVVSANTDGIVIKLPMGIAATHIIGKWEKITGFNTEETMYKSLYSRDVNNYLAVKTDGTVKTKGVFADPGLMKNAVNTICVKAVIEYLTKGTPVAYSIRKCTDICEFLTVRTVSGGGMQGGKYLGKVVRWHYSTQSPGPITYKTNGNKAAKSDGSQALMTLPDELPPDLDYDWYIREAEDMLKDVGIND